MVTGSLIWYSMPFASEVIRLADSSLTHPYFNLDGQWF